MKRMLEICQRWSDNYSATFSADKSVIVIQRTTGDDTEYEGFRLNGEELKIVKTELRADSPGGVEGLQGRAWLGETVSVSTSQSGHNN